MTEFWAPSVLQKLKIVAGLYIKYITALDSHLCSINYHQLQQNVQMCVFNCAFLLISQELHRFHSDKTWVRHNTLTFLVYLGLKVMACDLMIKQMLIKVLWFYEWASLLICSGFLVNFFHQLIKTAIKKVIFKNTFNYRSCYMLVARFEDKMFYLFRPFFHYTSVQKFWVSKILFYWLIFVERNEYFI